MAKTKEHEQAISLREKGNSISSISRQLGVSKSTVSVWCRDISLSLSAIKRVSNNGKMKATIALLQYSESVRQKRIIDTQRSMGKGAHMLGKLNQRDIYCLGLGLYWGEGYKRGSQEFGFTNSDPDMIIFYIKWLKTVFGADKNQLILRVSINAMHTDRIKEVEKYWSRLTNVPLDQFTKSSLIKTRSEKVYKNTQAHMGTLRIKVRRGTAMRREVIGAIKSIAL